MNKTKIIGGYLRSRHIIVIDSIGLRPTLARVRETLFNWLGQDLSGKNCLDLFAGCGALGYESISRNAKSATLIELNYNAYQQLQKNKKILDINNATIINENAIEYIKNCNTKFDIIFVDPPYNSNLLQESLNNLSKLMHENTQVFVEYQNLEQIQNYKIIKQAKYGAVKFAILTMKF